MEFMFGNMRSRQTGQTSSLPTRGGRRKRWNDPGWPVPRSKSYYHARLSDTEEMSSVVCGPMVKGTDKLCGIILTIVSKDQGNKVMDPIVREQSAVRNK